MSYFDEIIYLSNRLLKYESIYGHGGITDEAIFGKTIVDCHKDILEYCESIGLKTYLDPEGAYSYAETSSGDDYIAILTHLDVVAPGDLSHWNYPPFQATIKEDKLIARGSADDKVPAAIGVLAIKKLLDEGGVNYPIRLIFGSDEETGFRGINKYKKENKAPKYTLVMDGTFPFSYSEKHLLNYELHTNSHIKLEGGIGFNSVMDHVVWDGLEVKGRSAHASRPHLGDNALVKMAYLHSGKDVLFDIVSQLKEPNGDHKLIFLKDNFKSETTLCIGKVNNHILYVDIRIPPEMNLETFKDSFEAYIKDMGVEPKLTDEMLGSKTDTKSDFAKTVLKCYQEITGDYQSKPFKTGSATYGRSFENCISFGPRMGYHITNTHKANEFVPFDLIENAFEIYVHTLKTIGEEL